LQRHQAQKTHHNDHNTSSEAAIENENTSSSDVIEIFTSQWTSHWLSYQPELYSLEHNMLIVCIIISGTYYYQITIYYSIQ
jgi:hypothetical protein